LTRSPLARVLLDLGLEDWIPLPQAVADPEVIAAAGEADPVPAIARALSELVDFGAILIYRGRWDGDSSPVPAREAQALLQERSWYRFRLADPDEERLYFVNAENVRPVEE
jgi:hypothetical protein